MSTAVLLEDRRSTRVADSAAPRAALTDRRRRRGLPARTRGATRTPWCVSNGSWEHGVGSIASGTGASAVATSCGKGNAEHSEESSILLPLRVLSQESKAPLIRWPAVSTHPRYGRPRALAGALNSAVTDSPRTDHRPQMSKKNNCRYGTPWRLVMYASPVPGRGEFHVKHSALSGPERRAEADSVSAERVDSDSSGGHPGAGRNPLLRGMSYRVPWERFDSSVFWAYGSTSAVPGSGRGLYSVVHSSSGAGDQSVREPASGTFGFT